MIIELSVAVVAIGFIVLVVYLARTLTAAKKALEQANQTLAEVKESLNEVTFEAKTLIRNTNQIVMETQHDIRAVQPLFDTVKNIGELLEGATSAVKQVAAGVASSQQKREPSPEQTRQSSVQAISELVMESLGWIGAVSKFFRRNKT